MRIVLPDDVIPHGALRVEAGKIAEIRAGDPPPDHHETVVNGVGLLALPGLVDLHGDMIERELEPRPGSFLPVPVALFELDKRLAAAGITTAFAAISFASFSLPDSEADAPGDGMPGSVVAIAGKPNKLRIEQTARDLVLAINELRPHLQTDIRIHARFEVTYPRAKPVLLDLIEREQVHLVSLMDHTPGQGQFRNIETYLRYMTGWLQVERAAVERALHELLAGAEQSTASQTLREVSDLCRRHNIILASHDDDTELKVQLMADLQTTLSEFPITLEAAMAARNKGMWVAMGAPNALRGGSHSGNASALEIMAAGALDILMTDYYPIAMLHAALNWVRQGVIDLPQAAQLVASNPARVAGLHDRGTLTVGQAADLVLVQPEPWPRVAATLRNGKFIYWSDLLPTPTA